MPMGRRTACATILIIDRTVRSSYIPMPGTIRQDLPARVSRRRNLSREDKPMIAAPSKPLHLVADEESAKRRQILDGARKVFMDLGFDGASMGEIARSAGVSKGTLYVYFADKNRLFEAIVEETALEQGEIAFDFDASGDAATTLREFGAAYIALILPFIFQAAPPPSPTRVAVVIESAVRMFLAAYGKK